MYHSLQQRSQVRCSTQRNIRPLRSVWFPPGLAEDAVPISDDAQQVTGQHDDLGGLIRVVEVHAPMRLRVLVCPDGAGEEVGSRLRLDALAALADPAMADAAPAPDVRSNTDALLLDLGRQFETARFAEDEATDRFADAEAGLHAALPEKPAGLLFRDGDHAFKLRRLHMHPDGFEGLPVTPSDIAWMRRQPIQHDVLRDARDGEQACEISPAK